MSLKIKSKKKIKNEQTKFKELNQKLTHTEKFKILFLLLAKTTLKTATDKSLFKKRGKLMAAILSKNLHTHNEFTRKLILSLSL